jgi:hypothetical protein
MERISDQLPGRHDMTRRVLTWISCAKSPLTALELQTALAVESGDPDFDTDNIVDTDELLSVSAGLITIDEKTQVVRLVHYTAQEYFLRHATHLLINPHRTLFDVSISYVSFDTFKMGPCPDDASLEKHVVQYPLLTYATSQWQEHMSECIGGRGGQSRLEGGQW